MRATSIVETAVSTPSPAARERRAVRSWVASASSRSSRPTSPPHAAGHGGLVLLGGEPGVGKTRLLDELGGARAPRGMTAAVGPLLGGRWRPALLALGAGSARRAATGRVRPAWRPRSACSAALLAAHLPELAPGSSTSPARTRRRGPRFGAQAVRALRRRRRLPEHRPRPRSAAGAPRRRARRRSRPRCDCSRSSRASCAARRSWSCARTATPRCAPPRRSRRRWPTRHARASALHLAGPARARRGALRRGARRRAPVRRRS